MAKRRRLEVPNLSDLEQGVATGVSHAKPSLGAMSAPISKVIAESATVGAAETEAARIKAGKYDQALAKGLLLQAITLAEIGSEYISRDRGEVLAEGLIELKESIRAHGLRTPIEIELADGREYTYGLISGWRRLHVVREPFDETGEMRFASIAAFVRNHPTTADAYVAMVEENEIREDLGPLERGRVVQMSVDAGACGDVDAAVNGLFAQASKAKRSKIRSYALVYGAIGDVISFPKFYSERALLILSKAVKEGMTGELRTAVDNTSFASPEAEWEALSEALSYKVSRAKPVKAAVKFDYKIRRENDEIELKISGQGAVQALLKDLDKWLKSRLKG